MLREDTAYSYSMKYSIRVTNVHDEVTVWQRRTTIYANSMQEAIKQLEDDNPELDRIYSCYTIPNFSKENHYDPRM